MKHPILTFSFCVLLTLSASCGKPSSPPKSPVIETITPKRSPDTPKAIRQSEAISGSQLNKVFPEASGDFHLTFTQEKDGFAAASLTKKGVKLATLSVSDTAANPSAREKFQSSGRRIGGYPAAAVGAQGTAVLVGDRYQVQARSLAPSFTEGDRETWLERFKLSALANVRK